MTDILKLPLYDRVGCLFSMGEYDYSKFRVTNFDEFKRYLRTLMCDFKTLETFMELKEDIKECIPTGKSPKTFIKDKINFKGTVMSVSKVFKDSDEIKYKPIIENTYKIINGYIRQSTAFIINNANEIFQIIDEAILKEKEEIKQSRKEINKRYYEKQKKLLGIKDKGIKLTEEEKKEKKRIANEKYRQKRKENTLEKTDETILSMKEKKRQYNTTYYTKQKEMRNKIKELEQKLAEAQNSNI
jgi:hypothetical protein